LDIPTFATNDEIKDAYRALAKKHHPDVRAGSSSTAGEYDPDVEKFRNVVEAYQVLSVKESRAAFDMTRKKNPELFRPQLSEEMEMMNRRD
jgi:curved DNA-binding protein